MPAAEAALLAVGLAVPQLVAVQGWWVSVVEVSRPWPRLAAAVPRQLQHWVDVLLLVWRPVRCCLGPKAVAAPPSPESQPLAPWAEAPAVRQQTSPLQLQERRSSANM